jgi:hypothetical protein
MRICYNCYWSPLGYINGNNIYDGRNNVVGFYDGNSIFNNYGYRLGYYDNNRLYDNYGTYAGSLNGNVVVNIDNSPVGFLDTATDWLLAAALLFLFL